MSGNSCRSDILFEIYLTILQLQRKGVTVVFAWVPAHVGVDGNEDVDILAKQSLALPAVSIEIPLSKSEGKAFIKSYVQQRWQ